MIRFFCRPTKLALSCIEALHREHFVVRILPIGAIHFSTSPEWEKYRLMFMTSVTDDYINVVCSDDDDDLDKYLTVGVQNIAVMKIVPGSREGYDACAVSAVELVEILKRA